MAQKKYEIAFGDKTRDENIIDNLGLVRKAAYIYSKKCTLEFDDLYQAGIPGLIKAVDKFEPERGFKFSTYAHAWIKQSITKYMEDEMQLPPSISRKRWNVYKARKSIEEANMEPTIEAIAELTELQPNDVLAILSGKLYTSFDDSYGEDDEGKATLKDKIPDTAKGVEEQALDNEKYSLLLSAIEERLTKKEQEVIVTRYLSSDGDVLTFEQTSQKLNTSRQNVQQLEKHALRKLKFTPLIQELANKK